MRLLVTGFNGFIGTELLRILSVKGHFFRLVGRSPCYYPGIPRESVECIYTPCVFLESLGWWQRQLEDIDCVVHLAWSANPTDYLSSPLNELCLSGTVTLARACAVAELRSFVGVGSCLEYNASAEKPFTTCTELYGASLYAKSKISAYLGLRDIFETTNVCFSWARIFNVYGSNEPKGKLYTEILDSIDAGRRIVLKNPSCIRDFVPVEKVALDIEKILIGDTPGPSNLCTGVPLSVRDFSEYVVKNIAGRNVNDFLSNAKHIDHSEFDSIWGIPSYD